MEPTFVTMVRNLREEIEFAFLASRERSLALTKLEECELWLSKANAQPPAETNPAVEGRV